MFFLPDSSTVAGGPFDDWRSRGFAFNNSSKVDPFDALLSKVMDFSEIRVTTLSNVVLIFSRIFVRVPVSEAVLEDASEALYSCL